MKHKPDELMAKAGNTVRENVAHIIFAAVVILMILISFVSLKKGDGVFDWFNFIINLALQLSIFIPYRWRQKRISAKGKPYSDNVSALSEKVDELHETNQLEKFAEFCEVKTADLLRARRLEIIHAAGIDTATYDSKKYDALTEKQLKAIEEASKATVKPINPLCITSNSHGVTGYGVDFNDTAEDCKSVVNKIWPMILWAVILIYIALDGLHYAGISAIVMIVFRIVMCLSSMFSAIMSGEGFVSKKNKVILRRLDFIQLFHEWVGVETSSNTYGNSIEEGENESVDEDLATTE